MGLLKENPFNCLKDKGISALISASSWDIVSSPVELVCMSIGASVFSSTFLSLSPSLPGLLLSPSLPASPSLFGLLLSPSL